MTTSDVMSGRARAGLHTKLTVRDVSRACFYAPSVRPVYVKISEEDHGEGDEHRCGRLNISMHGTRDAALS